MAFDGRHHAPKFVWRRESHLEARVWPTGAVCPHCGGHDRIGRMRGKGAGIGT